ncbi:heme NO-binding domain-containing protein [Shewanella sp. POL2]|uniref:heme NO-binding domain-containing protein n=1 Tax=Shewanella sp. POL2 TaxID=1201295 RepID=UPI0002FB9846|nr:heme NO-binding domain-containing protein [Shewanella sp. POL2]
MLEDMVVAQCGMSVWNDLLEKHAPKDRVYVSAKSYAESELFSIVQDVAQRLNMPIQDVVKAFGQFLFNGLASRHAGVVEHFEDFTSLVMGIHDVIHLEVNKLYHEPSLPNITGQHLSDNQIALRYSSPRRLCFCAEGLLFGAAEHFKQKIQITHDTCMHTGADHCMLIIELQHD